MRALDNIRVLELAGLAPGPFAGLLLAFSQVTPPAQMF